MNPRNQSIAYGWAVLWIGFSLTMLASLAHDSPAQELKLEGESRKVPAPWRPAFGPLNRASSPPLPERFSNQNNAAPSQPTVPVDRVAERPKTENNSTGDAVAPQAPTRSDESTSATKVTRVLNTLPNSAGQVWREYDISPYTSRITNSANPQQAIIDWILKETGTEMWFNHPLGILNATESVLYVYHTPAVQETVRKLVDRFVYTQGQVQAIDITLMTLDNPNWRSSVYQRMQPIESQSLGVEAFLLSKENAALVINQLSQRGDAKLVNSGTVNNHDGQPFVLRNTRLTQFFNRLQWLPNQVPSYQPLTANVNEGYSVSINCLSSLDRRTIEAIVKCDIDQIEKLTNVAVAAPNPTGNAASVDLQIPQIISWRLHERFRWSNDQVLLLTCGIVSGIDPSAPRTGPVIPLLANNLRTKRAEALLFIDYRGPTQEANLPQASANGLVPIVPRR